MNRSIGQELREKKTSEVKMKRDREVKNMNEQVSKEIASAARLLDMEISEVEEKWLEICQTNDLNPVDDWRIGLSCLRQWFSGTKAYKEQDTESTGKKSDFAKKAVGYFISVDAARDMAEYQNERVKKEYAADPDTTYQIGRVALVNLTDSGDYEITRMEKGEEKAKVFGELPENSHEIEVNEWIVPLDNMPSYGTRTNPNFGKPLPASQFRMAGIFVGDVDGEDGLYYFSYKGESSKEFIPRTYELLSMTVIRDQTNTDRIYGFKAATLESLVYNADREDGVEAPSLERLQEHTMEHAVGHYSQLANLNRYHAEKQGETYAKRFVITDGSVSSVNMTPNSWGTRRITVTDLNTDFDYEGGGWAGTTCWVPSHVDINFGIGSSVIIVGRTSQGRSDDGQPADATVNVSGILVTENRGTVVEAFTSDAQDVDWF